MNARAESLVWWDASFVHVALSVRELTGCLSQGSLKPHVPLFVNTIIFGGFIEARPVLQKVFHHVLFGFVLLTHLLSTFSNSSSNFRTVFSYFCSFSGFLWHLWQVCSLSLFLHLCSSSKQPLYCLLLLHSLVLVVDKKMPSLWLCPSTCQKDLFLLSSSTQSLWKDQGSCKSCKAGVTDCWWSNDCFQFTEECPFAKMLVCQSQVFSVLLLWFQSKYHRRRRCSTVILKELQGKEEEWF